LILFFTAEAQRTQSSEEKKMQEPGDGLNDLTSAVISAAIEVHKALGPGFLEQTYAKALAIELFERKIEFATEVPVSLQYKGHSIGEGRLDFLVSKQLIVELKAVDEIHPVHHAQVISYLKATGFTLGLLINFNVDVLKDGIRRIILS
jgi:GxxExxY protein